MTGCNKVFEKKYFMWYNSLKEKDFLMKKIVRKLNFALVGLMVSVAPAMAAESGMCNLVKRLGDVLTYVRLLAFIGAGFTVSKWAWDYIKAGDVGMDKVKDQGSALLIGSFMLFMVGALLSFLISAAGPGGSFDCYTELSKW